MHTAEPLAVEEQIMLQTAYCPLTYNYFTSPNTGQSYQSFIYLN